MRFVHWSVALGLALCGVVTAHQSAQAQGLTERALSLGASKSLWEQLKDEGGIREAFFGVTVFDARGSWNTEDALDRLILIVDPSSAPKKIRGALDNACHFSGANWEVDTSFNLTGKAAQDGKTCSYVCDPGKECNIFMEITDWPKAKLSLAAVSPAPVENSNETPSSIPLNYDEGVVKKHCDEEWTKRGVVDLGMSEFCATQQREAWLELKQLYEEKRASDSQLAETIITEAIDKWTKRDFTDFSMAKYSAELEFEAVLDIEYEKGLPNADVELIAACERKWLDPSNPFAGTGAYGMVAYCIKNGL